MQYYITFISLFYISISIFASSPKREMRGVWVSTVTNIDFPKQLNASVEDQKKEIRNILDQHQSDGINTIFFQVRPAADAFYKSDFEPWSRYLNGKQGIAPMPFYDPLQYFIEEAHKRNIELHAWINPFRIRTKLVDELTPNHPYSKHKNWGWDYMNKSYFDPGIPEVRDYCKKIVLDIVSRYDIDGIHFDDYFYPYRTNKTVPLPDSATFKKYGNEFYPNQKEDWRRNNVNLFVEDIYTSIKEIKPWVKFGISPFGIWKNSTSPNDGLPTQNGLSNYDILYADVLTWLKEGWVDYCIPQLYWAIGYQPADFSKLLTWWSNHSYGRNLYVGHCLYKIDSASKEQAWQSPLEIERQIELSRKTDNVNGSVFYSSNHFIIRKEIAPLREALRDSFYNNYALKPEMPWIDKKAPDSPHNPQYISTDKGHFITWEAPEYKSEMDKAYWYVIYKIADGKAKNQLEADNIVSITQDTVYEIFVDSVYNNYFITALDRLQNESKPQRVKLISNHKNSIVFKKEEDVPEFAIKQNEN